MSVSDLLAESLARYGAGYRARSADADPWRDCAEQGWLAMRLPEALGGVDAGASECGLLMEACGRWLIREPLLGTMLATGALLRAGTADQRERWLPALGEGRARAALVASVGAAPCRWENGTLSGAARGVLHGGEAQLFLVVAQDAAGPLLCLVEAASVQRRAYRLVDGRDAADVVFADTPAQALEHDTQRDAAALLLDEAATALCAESLGVVTALVAATREHLVTRQQFGRPLAANQALTHRLVEMHLLQEEIRALTLAAQAALAQPAAQRARSVAGASAYTLGALRRVANEAVQMHGGLGITGELAVSHYYRRALVIGALYGGRAPQLARFAAAPAA